MHYLLVKSFLLVIEAKSYFGGIIGLTELCSNQIFQEFLLYQSRKKGKLMNLGLGLTTYDCGRLCSKQGCLDRSFNNGMIFVPF
ncbi:hypothetical protein CRYUN_Cryun39dG0078200 [Craigia yunnanensis]